jgi:hypothetical protein
VSRATSILILISAALLAINSGLRAQRCSQADLRNTGGDRLFYCFAAN